MKRFQTPTLRNPVLVHRRTENRTHEVRKSLPGSTKTGRYIEIQRLKRLIYILSSPILSELISAGFSLWKTPDRKGMGKGAEWHNTQFCVLRSTRATRRGRWKPITKDRKNNTPAIPTLTQAGVNTTSISSSRRADTTTSFKTVSNRRVPRVCRISLRGRQGTVWTRCRIARLSERVGFSFGSAKRVFHRLAFSSGRSGDVFSLGNVFRACRYNE